MAKSVRTDNINSAVWGLSIATFINRSTGFLGLFAAVFFTHINISDGTLPLALLIVGVAGVLGSLAGGQLADRFGRLATLMGSTLLNVVLLFALAFTPTALTWLIVALAAVSVALSQMFVGPASALIAESAQGKERVTRFAFYRIFINVGSIVAPALVGLIGRDKFPVLFLISALASLVVPVILWLSMRGYQSGAPVVASSDAEPGGRTMSTTAGASTRRQLVALALVYAAMALAMIIYAQHQSAIPLQLQTLPHGVQLYSLLLIINPIIVIAVEYPLSHMTKRMPAYLALMVGILVMSLGIFVTGSFGSVFALAVGGWVLFSLGECVFAPMSNTYVAELASEAGQASAQGRLSAAQAIGQALGPSLGSWMLLALAAGAWTGFVLLALLACALVYGARIVAASRAQPEGNPFRAPNPR